MPPTTTLPMGDDNEIKKRVAQGEEQFVHLVVNCVHVFEIPQSQVIDAQSSTASSSSWKSAAWMDNNRIGMGTLQVYEKYDNKNRRRRSSIIANGDASVTQFQIQI